MIGLTFFVYWHLLSVTGSDVVDAYVVCAAEGGAATWFGSCTVQAMLQQMIVKLCLLSRGLSSSLCFNHRAFLHHHMYFCSERVIPLNICVYYTSFVVYHAYAVTFAGCDAMKTCQTINK